jgi:hypothetical protein
MVKAKEAQRLNKAAGFLHLVVRAGVTAWTEWDLVQEETGV